MIIEWFKKNLLFIILGLFIMGFVFITKESENSLHSEIAPVDHPEKDEEELLSEESVLIDIKGEIHKPGVYELPHDARVNDVIEQASGFTDKADETAINLAQKVHDEMIIIVPSESDEQSGTSSQQSGTSAGQEAKVRVNYATQEEIETLPGIGPAKAQAIIDYREENGLFQTIDDLLDISGIGEKTLENMRDYLQIP